MCDCGLPFGAGGWFALPFAGGRLGSCFEF
jgi:hypothetical protein